MVLQRDTAAPVWGWSRPGAEISVTFGDQTQRTTASESGRWSVKLLALKAGGPYELKVSGDGEIVLQDVLVGEVWLCSGQSNMAMNVSAAKDFEAERAKSNLPGIRHFKTAAHATPEIQNDCQGSWAVCSPDTIGSFTATGFFFGRNLHEELDVPIGLINSSWGGTDIAAWTSLSAQQAQDAIVPKLQEYEATLAGYDAAAAESQYVAALGKWEQRKVAAAAAGQKIPNRPRAPVSPETDQNRPANLFNGMIHPIIPFAIRGAIWYQGERNTHSNSDGALYQIQLKALITDWRSRWGQGDFAFGTVQLPNFHAPQVEPVETTGWVLVRESELKSLELPNTGMAVTTDVGDPANIHPKNKQTVGQRLALWALAKTYGKSIPYSGPMLVSHAIREGRSENGNTPKPGRVVLEFQHADGLGPSEGDKLNGFAIAGEDRVFVDAEAVINPKTGKLVVSSPHVLRPAAVRYNWADNPKGNLINAAGLPASAFRTDKWDFTREN